jgi:spore coat protein H
MLRLACAVALVAAIGCGSDDSSNPAQDAGVDVAAPDAWVDLSGPYFDPAHIVDVSITMAPTDWDALRKQTRSFGSVIEGDCLAQPIPSPFTDFSASITVDGTTFPQVQIHKKGFFGSLDATKPSLKVDLDAFVADTEYLGLEKLTLNNSHQDPSFVRQCLAYQMFGQAGVVVPRCNFAHVRVNGTDLGIYVNVETIDHHLARRRYADGTGGLFEGTLSDFRTGWTNTFDIKGDGDRKDLTPLVTALETATDANLVSSLAPHLDVDRFLTYWAMEMITNHWDGYANDRNNFFVYHDPSTDKLDFIPWGVDATFQPNVTFSGIGNTAGPVAIAAAGMLTNRLWNNPPTKQMILDRERQLLANVFDETKLLAEVTRMEALIAPIEDAVSGTGWHTGVADVRTFINQRRNKLGAALDAGPTWTQPLAGYPCLDIVAKVTGTFSARYGTLGSMNPLATGSGTFQITIGGTTSTLTPVGALAGTDTASGLAIVQVFGQRASDGHVFAVSIGSLPMYFFPRGVDIGFFDGQGAVYEYNPTTDMTQQVGIMFGSMALTQGSTTANAVVAGSFTSNADVQGTP